MQQKPASNIAIQFDTRIVLTPCPIRAAQKLRSLSIGCAPASLRRVRQLNRMAYTHAILYIGSVAELTAEIVAVANKS
jgi:hypothetical protein